ncbi:hypothetical protein [Thermodesulfitimonas autotrophica]|uniref:hypothetical protein n=1 Tax=Thermodesulfitimonas autotrophica TaxID=1894989 RepID=UPI000F4D603D|nr:hypothetical protein [Thermodesulfitimonas autotrophica]
MTAVAITNLWKKFRIYHDSKQMDREHYYRVNFSGTLNLFEAVREAAPRARVLYAGWAPAIPFRQTLSDLLAWWQEALALNKNG